MKFIFDKEWLQKHADRDDNLEIAAGSFSLDQLPVTEGDPSDRTAVLASAVLSTFAAESGVGPLRISLRPPALM